MDAIRGKVRGAVGGKVKVKICGITSVEQGVMAANAGADAIGLVFYAKSPRCVSAAVAADIVQAVGPFVMTVGLFVNETVALVQDTSRQTGIQLLQFHGDEDAAYCEQFERPFIKAIRMAPEIDVAGAVAAHPKASGYLFDAWQADAYGGTGKAFDWARLSQEASVSGSVILAGGLSSDNIAAAVAQTRPYAVDVSSGVESAPGIKDPDRVQRFIEQARSV